MSSSEMKLEILELRGVVTSDRTEAEVCCGLPRDDDGFCTYKPGHHPYRAHRAENALPPLSNCSCGSGRTSVFNRPRDASVCPDCGGYRR